MSTNISNQLFRAGYKQTIVRKRMVELFDDLKKPVSVEHILASLKNKKLTPNKTTVYREIDFLQHQSIIREVELGDGKKRYERISEGHHHHAVCTRCRDIQCVELKEDVDELEKTISRKNHFKITGHFLEFFGVCAKCK